MVLKFLENAVNVWVLLKPREHAGQYGEQAGSVRQSPGGGGGAEDPPADGGEGEGGYAPVYSPAQVFQRTGAFHKGTQEATASPLKRFQMERIFSLFFFPRVHQGLLKRVRHFAWNSVHPAKGGGDAGPGAHG